MEAALPKKPKIILIYSPGQSFLSNAICAILKEAELPLTFIQQIGDKQIVPPVENTEFLVLEMNYFDKEEEIEADIIFTNIHEQEHKSNPLDLVRWMRSPKHAYCMDESEHPQGLHNYNNLKNFILPMAYVFKEHATKIKAINPSKLIEILRPEEERQRIKEAALKKQADVQES